MPVLEGRIAFHPLRGNVEQYEKEKESYEKAKIAVHLDSDLYANISFLPLNAAESFGLLRVMDSDDSRPSPRDIVLCKTLPNEMPRVAGVITEERQTPLSHVNLRAIQDKVPNAFIEGASNKKAIESLIGKLVHYKVTSQGYALREATQAEVDKHFDALRPSETQTPKRDLSIDEIRPLGEIAFEQSSSFGVKTANMATMRGFGFAEGAVPDGFAIPFSFYHRFMEHNGFYETVDRLLGDEELKKDRDKLKKALKKFRKTIRGGDFPDDLGEALSVVQKSFEPGQSIRCRSSTNNEDLPGFSGAGLYDSFTHKPDEGRLSKSIRQVFASLWNFRAFEEREFYRIDHKVAAMGVLLHPNFKEERANGVAVTEDILYGTQGNYYLNTQVGEDLVTNPDEDSSPEETLLGWYEKDGHEIVRRSAEDSEKKGLLSKAHLDELRKCLAKIHGRFAKHYGRSPEDLKFAMEIEFKITKDDQLVIKQARPWVF
ncbi:MAG: PEP/pyruvate-binding domain-containing protein [Verrucomicrobiota bacterium]